MAIFKAMDQFLDWPIQDKCGTGSFIGGQVGDAVTAPVVNAVFCGKGNAAYDAKWRSDWFDLLQALGAEMNISCVWNEHPAQVTKGGKKDVKEGPEKQTLEPHVLVDHQHPQVGEARLTVYYRGYPADPPGSSTVGAETGL